MQSSEAICHFHTILPPSAKHILLSTWYIQHEVLEQATIWIYVTNITRIHSRTVLTKIDLNKN